MSQPLCMQRKMRFPRSSSVCFLRHQLVTSPPSYSLTTRAAAAWSAQKAQSGRTAAFQRASAVPEWTRWEAGRLDWSQNSWDALAVADATRILECGSQWIKQLLGMFGPEWIHINWLIKTARSAVLKNSAERGFFLAASAAKFWKHDISSASERAFRDFFGDIFGCSTLIKKRWWWWLLLLL